MSPEVEQGIDEAVSAADAKGRFSELLGTVKRGRNVVVTSYGRSRRIMSMRFRPANISVINRRASSKTVIGPAVQNLLKAHQQDHVPATPPVETVPMPERCSPSRVRFRRAQLRRALTAARRSGQVVIATGGVAGT